MPLIVVESPTKIRTLRKILDGDWAFCPTKGHLYDLPEDEMGIDESYDPEWVPLNRSQIGSIRSAAQGSGEVYLASDPDREGEAIAWQVANIVLEDAPVRRLRLESITDDAVHSALDDPGEIDHDRVSAQWARRLLDRLAGYKVSPLLIGAFKGKTLSAGRVQSAVLARIVERWDEVQEFTPVTFYNIGAQLQPQGEQFPDPIEASLHRLEGDVVGTDEGERLITDEEQARAIVDAIDREGVQLLDRREEETQTHPDFPFESSSLIRAASNWFNWPAGKTMKLAQILYEKGLITYHRSDSTRISRQGCAAAAAFIREEYGDAYHQWRGGGGGEQEGHEAIRAQNPGLRPQDLRKISGDLKTLYTAIWQRYVRSQMTSARWSRIRLDFEPRAEGHDLVLRASERTIEEWGFLRCQRPGETPLPERERARDEFGLIRGAAGFRVASVECSESQTRGPQLYTEGSLIDMMKREGIGRPSTYGSTIGRLRSRQYIETQDGRIVPTQRGRDVCRYLLRAVPRICDVELTKEMESTLDQIARGEVNWKEFVRGFDERLDRWLEEAEGIEPEGDAEGFKEPLEFETCPRCDTRLILREGRYGKFVHCEAEDCDFSSDPPAKTYRCPECRRHMVKPNGNRSTVYRCIAHPECSGRRPVGHPHTTYEEFLEEAPDCPECGGQMTKRKGRYGTFWGCTSYPDCDGTRSMSGS